MWAFVVGVVLLPDLAAVHAQTAPKPQQRTQLRGRRYRPKPPKVKKRTVPSQRFQLFGRIFNPSKRKSAPGRTVPGQRFQLFGRSHNPSKRKIGPHRTVPGQRFQLFGNRYNPSGPPKRTRKLTVPTQRFQLFGHSYNPSAGPSSPRRTVPGQKFQLFGRSYNPSARRRYPRRTVPTQPFQLRGRACVGPSCGNPAPRHKRYASRPGPWPFRLHYRTLGRACYAQTPVRIKHRNLDGRSCGAGVQICHRSLDRKGCQDIVICHRPMNRYKVACDPSIQKQTTNLERVG